MERSGGEYTVRLHVPEGNGGRGVGRLVEEGVMARVDVRKYVCVGPRRWIGRLMS